MVKAVRPARGAVTTTAGPADAGCVAPSDGTAGPLLRPGALGRAARRGVVVLAAGVLVAGDLGSLGLAADRSPGGQAGATSATRPVLGGLSARIVETQQRATVSRAESLALADAALRAAAAAQSLTRTPSNTAADAGLTADASVESTVPTVALTALESAAQEAAAAEVLEPLVARPLMLVPDPEALDEDAWVATGSSERTGSDAYADEPTGDEPATVDGPSEADLAEVPPGADLPAGEPLPGEIATEEPTTPAADDAGETLTTAAETAQLAGAVERLDALVRAAQGLADQPVDEIPVVPGTARTSSATPVADAASPATTQARAVAGHLALTVALREAAAEVFGLSLRVEGATEAAARAEVVARAEAVGALQAGAASTLATADSLPTLTPLSAEERAQRAALEAPVAAPSGVVTTRPMRVRAGASPAVAGLAARWSNGRLPADTMCEVEFDRGHLLQCDAAEALADLNEAYRAEFGTDLALTDSYRTLEGQIAVKAAKGALAATPGTSNHGWGLAVDIAGIGGLGDFDEPGYLWLKANADTFGWHHPRGMEPGGSSPQEPWHWEFATE